jgi:protein subunit release factor B
MENREKLFSVTLKDCDVQFYRGSGAGGQKRNKTESACRIVHRDSGAEGSCESFREQSKNKLEAFKKMSQTDKFKKWMKVEVSRVTGQLAEIEKQVEKELKRVTLEVKDENGRWKKVDDIKEETND